ncbi:ImcF-related family protein [Cupriavidus necator]|uniref:Type VI secretion protein VasK n=1 Tax=Cupriavidus pinatubonensis (strain JMP 134 / LMG 1197) TaxID=264198 RepID=Q477N3_CUPPJ|nr:ImcF-related family protein [Cupriavidus necator]
MTNPTSNLKVIAAEGAEHPNSRTATAWGVPIFAISIAALAAGVAWFSGDMLGLHAQSAKISALVWIAIILAIVLVTHFAALLFGAYPVIARLFERDAGEKPEIVLKRDARLQGLCDELRVLLGWRWRYRVPWLLVCGDDAQVDAVAPGLKQVGVLHIADAVLVHPSPDGIEATVWRKQLRQLRRRRPVDAVVQLVADDHSATGATEHLRVLSRIEADLGWAAPLTFLHVVEVMGKRPEKFEAVGAFAPVSRGRVPLSTPDAFACALEALERRVAIAGMQQCLEPFHIAYLAGVSSYVSAQRERVMDCWAAVHESKWRRATLAGVMFAPLYSCLATPVPVPLPADELADADSFGERVEPVHIEDLPTAPQEQPATLAPAWQAIGTHTAEYRGRRVGIHAGAFTTVLVSASIGLCIAGMLLSGLQNKHDIQAANQTVRDIQSAPNAIARLKALDTLQQQIQRYEYRIHHHAPLSTRFGLNRDDEVLAALWKPYAKSSRDLLIAPVTQDLEASLTDLSQLQTTGLNAEGSKWALAGRDTLKTYLMLAQPERADAAFLSQQLAQHWTTDARITPGQKQDLAERFARFYAEHLKSKPEWRITPRAELVAGTRQTLLAVIGERNAQDTIYQGILDGVGHKYPDLTLASLTAGTDARGLLRTTAVVPGAFTRQAYEEHVAPAIEQAAKRRDVVNDWVLTDGRPSARSDTDNSSGLDLQTALTDQYFADYAEHWQQFMNTLQCEPAPTLPGVIDQLKLMADARLSPVIALMRSLEYQGSAGIRKESLPDALVNKAKDLLGKKREGAEASPAEPAGPLTAGFGPVLRLIGQSGQGNAGELSLQRFLDRATALRLRLQQVSNSPDADAQARQLAMALFQGKGSELADTQAYAQLIAASLGSQWAGMGDALFVRPIAQATQTVLQPAQASLNDDWRQSIALPWMTAFAGRYPFTNSANDASFAELGRYLRPQSGLIHTFLVAQLGGVLEQHGDQWLPAANAQGLAFDPAFLKTIATLQRIGAHMLTQGDARYRFELKPIPTPGLTDTLLIIDNQKLHYFNQRETWQTMTWPVDNLQTPRTILQWQTETAGTSANYEFAGRWGLVRMLERARIVPLDSATFQLTWQAVPDANAARAGWNDSEPEAREPLRPDNAASLTPRDAKVPAPSGMVYPIRYQMRADVGTGPLEMLELRDLQMPERIFMVGKQGGAVTSQTR